MRRIATLAAAGVLVLALSAGPAAAVITVPIPTDPAAGPPPIPSLPVASDTAPPAEAISDPVEPAASCSGWYRQSNYAGIWPAGSTWWEYECTFEEVQYPWCYGLPGQCDAGYTIWGSWTDRYYWDGSQPIFYGESAGFGFYWWDAAASQWYAVSPSAGGTTPNAAPTAGFGVSCAWLGCSFDASASSDGDGTIQAYGWDFGDGATGTGKTVEHSYTQAGSYTVKLTVTDDGGASASASKTVTVEPAPPPPPNAAPTASFGVSCAGLVCSLDGGGSSDGDGTIQAYGWDFGDNSNGSGETAQHSYTQAGSYTVKLTVTDDDGAAGTASKAITPIGLTAHGYKLKGLQKVELSWNGSTGGSFDVYRGGQKIASVAGSSYTDNLNRNGSGSYRYQVCQTESAICSNQATVSF